MYRAYYKYEEKSSLCSFQDPQVSLYEILSQPDWLFGRDCVTDNYYFRIYNISIDS